jgi:hypothetical protein
MWWEGRGGGHGPASHFRRYNYFQFRSLFGLKLSKPQPMTLSCHQAIRCFLFLLYFLLSQSDVLQLSGDCSIVNSPFEGPKYLSPFTAIRYPSSKGLTVCLSLSYKLSFSLQGNFLVQMKIHIRKFHSIPIINLFNFSSLHLILNTPFVGTN